jgi:peptidoglycan/xylan/chitin deacetylase (PgdA/CDA1 family)
MRAILSYHSIDASGSPVSLAPESFRCHLDWFASGRVRVLPLAELLAAPEEPDAVALTFDDALVSFDELAWPALRERRLPVALFVPVSHLGGDNAWGGAAERRIPRLPVIGREGLRRLAGEGVEVGSHGLTHRDLRALSEEELERELAESRWRLEELTGSRPTAIAYPYGAHDARVAAAAGRFYSLGLTTELRPLGPGTQPMRLPRLDAYYLPRRESLEGFGTRRFTARLAARRLLRQARRRLTQST